MPSNKKKNSKTLLKSSNSDQDFNYFSSVSSTVSSSPLALSNDQLLCSLDESSEKFPSLISQIAFIVNVVDDAVSDSRGCKIWLSESPMVSSSIAPNSLVSVSLPLVGSGFPFTALSDECVRHAGLELPDNLPDEVGNFFALATVFPSCKVLKNGVPLSSNLSYTSGFQASGMILKGSF